MKITIFKFSAVLLSLIFSFLTGEFIVRSVYPQLLGKWSERGRFYKYDPMLGWRGIPNAAGDFIQRDFNVKIKNNDTGFRGKKYSYQKIDEVERILVIGDSYVWGYGVEENDVFTAIMERELKNTEIINLGCSGYGNDQELLLLESEGMKYDSDEVIIVVTLPSDLINNSHSVQYSYPKPFYMIENNVISL